MKKDISFLHFLQETGIAKDFPRLSEYVALHDIQLPELGKMFQFHDILGNYRTRKLYTPTSEQLLNAQKDAQDKEASRHNPFAATPAPDIDPTTINMVCSEAVKESVTEKSFSLSTFLDDVLSWGEVLTCPLESLSKYYQRKINDSLDEIVQQIPPELAERYRVNSPVERALCFMFQSIGARYAAEDHHPNLLKHFHELCRRQKLPRIPKLLIIESDEPNACALTLPQEYPVVALSTDLIEHLNDRQLDAVMAHELRHIKERKTHILGHVVKQTINALNDNHSLMLEELRADENIVRLGLQAEDMVDALIIISQRVAQLRQAGIEVMKALTENHVMPSAHHGLEVLSNLAKLPVIRLLSHENLLERSRAIARDAHPPLEDRFSRLYGAEEAQGIRR